MMEHVLEVMAYHSAVAIDLIAVVVIGIGTIEAVVQVVRIVLGQVPDPGKRAVWLRYARWLSAGLTFQLAADIVHTSITPTWDEVGKLAAVAAIRTFLTFFLDRDIDIRKHETA